MGTELQIKETIDRLKEKNNWDDFKKDYRYGTLLSWFIVKPIIETNDPVALAKKTEEAAKEAAEKPAKEAAKKAAKKEAKEAEEKSHKLLLWQQADRELLKTNQANPNEVRDGVNGFGSN